MHSVTRHLVGETIEKEDRLISAKLFRTRTQLNMTRAELAAKTFIDEDAIVSYEQGIEAIPASTLVLISHAMGLSFDFFYGSDELHMHHETYAVADKMPALLT